MLCNITVADDSGYRLLVGKESTARGIAFAKFENSAEVGNIQNDSQDLLDCAADK